MYNVSLKRVAIVSLATKDGKTLRGAEYVLRTVRMMVLEDYESGVPSDSWTMRMFQDSAPMWARRWERLKIDGDADDVADAYITALEEHDEATLDILTFNTWREAGDPRARRYCGFYQLFEGPRRLMKDGKPVKVDGKTIVRNGVSIHLWAKPNEEYNEDDRKSSKWVLPTDEEVKDAIARELTHWEPIVEEDDDKKSDDKSDDKD